MRKKIELDGFLKLIFRLSQGTNVLAGITLTGIMLITLTDVVLRSLGKPIVGIFELVALFGAVVIGFSIPFTSWVRGHIYVDFFVLKLPRRVRKAFHIITRCLGMALFSMIAWNLVQMGFDLFRSGEVSPTLQMPFYPIVYGVGLVCGIQVLVLLGDIVKVLREEYE